MFKTVTAKLAKMRKPQNFVVYPFREGQETIIVQSNKSIGQFNIKTGEGVLNSKGSNYKYNHDLMEPRGAKPYTFPPEFIKECLKAQPESGDHLGQGIFVA